MKAKLIKKGDVYFLDELKIDGYFTIANSLAKPNGLMYNLSLKNCQAIERGYDLDELVNEEFFKFDQEARIVYRRQLQESLANMFSKALELMGDKKYSEEDMINIYILGGKYKTQKPESFLDRGNEIIQSLQQTEWDVEIVMDICGDKVYAFSEPALDEQGCLILKRIDN